MTLEPNQSPAQTQPASVQQPPSGTRSSHFGREVWIGVIATVIGLACLGVMLLVKDTFWGKLIVGGWLVFPPTFFFFEYRYKLSKGKSAHELQQLRDYQELASKIWAGFGAALGILFLKM